MNAEKYVVSSFPSPSLSPRFVSIVIDRLKFISRYGLCTPG